MPIYLVMQAAKGCTGQESNTSGAKARMIGSVTLSATLKHRSPLLKQGASTGSKSGSVGCQLT
jgi:hypothetical protein